MASSPRHPRRPGERQGGGAGCDHLGTGPARVAAAADAALRRPLHGGWNRLISIAAAGNRTLTPGPYKRSVYAASAKARVYARAASAQISSMIRGHTARG